MMNNNIDLLKKTCEIWKKSLTNEEKEAIKIYSDDSKDINSYLLENKTDDPEIEQLIETIDSALLKCESPCDLWITRIETFPKSELKIRLDSYTKSKMIKYPNFVSTSIKPNWEKEEKNLNFDTKKIQIIIKAKINKGTNCGYLDKDLSVFPSEKEILVLRNLTLFIKKIDYIEQHNKIEIIGILDYMKGGNYEK